MLVRAAAALAMGLAVGPTEAADLRAVPQGGDVDLRSGSAGSRVVTDIRAASAGILILDPGTTEVLRTTRPARTIAVGDPTVMEASVANETTILLTAKAAGFTNLILLDEDGNEFLRRTVRVGIPPRPIIVHRGDSVQPYLCDPICNQPPERVPQAAVQETAVTETVGTSRVGAPSAPAPGPASNATRRQGTAR
jgi:hypothetical protein